MFYAIMAGGLQGQEQGASADALAQLEARLSGMHASLVDQLRQDLGYDIFVRTYRDLSDEELEAYVDFLEVRSVRARYTRLCTPR